MSRALNRDTLRDSYSAHAAVSWTLRMTSALTVPMVVSVAIVAAQEVVRVTGYSTCGSCTINADAVATISGSDSVAFGRLDFRRIAMARGRVWISPMYMRHAAMGFDTSGALRVWLSRLGTGPSEFTRIDQIATCPGGTLHLFGDGKHNRYSATGAFVGTSRLVARPQDVVFLRDGRYIMNGTVPTAERAGYPLHVMSADDEPLVSFGAIFSSFELNPYEGRRFMAPSRQGGFWAARQNRYQIDLWDLSGTHSRRLLRETSWFTPWTTWLPPFEEPSPPRIYGLSEDSAGLLWVMLYVPDEDFEPLTPPDPSDPGSLYAPMGGDHPAFDTLIEVIDADRGVVLARRRFGAMLGGFLNGQHVVEPTLDEDGEQTFRILRLRLDRKDNSGLTTEARPL